MTLPTAPKPPKSPEIPPGVADGGATFEQELRWALDLLKRGDVDVAINRIERILRGTR